MDHLVRSRAGAAIRPWLLLDDRRKGRRNYYGISFVFERVQVHSFRIYWQHADIWSVCVLMYLRARTNVTHQPWPFSKAWKNTICVPPSHTLKFKTPTEVCCGLPRPTCNFEFPPDQSDVCLRAASTKIMTENNSAEMGAQMQCSERSNNNKCTLQVYRCVILTCRESTHAAWLRLCFIYLFTGESDEEIRDRVITARIDAHGERFVFVLTPPLFITAGGSRRRESTQCSPGNGSLCPWNESVRIVYLCGVSSQSYYAAWPPCLAFISDYNSFFDSWLKSWSISNFCLIWFTF